MTAVHHTSQRSVPASDPHLSAAELALASPSGHSRFVSDKRYYVIGSPIVNIGRLIGMESRDRTPFGQRMFDARIAAGLTQSQVREKTGMAQSTLSGLEHEAVSTRRLTQLAALYKVNPEWLSTGEGPRDIGPQKASIDIEDNPNYPAIKRVRFKLAAGVSGYEVDYFHAGEGAPIVFRKDWYEQRGLDPVALFAVQVAGDSMETGLAHGDTVVVNTAEAAPKDGEVFAVNFEGELVIKRLVRDGGEWWLSSDNPDQRRYPRKVCGEGVNLIGRIVHKQSERI